MSEYAFTLAVGYGISYGISYGVPYITRYVADKATTKIIGATTKAVKKKVSTTFYKSKDIDIEYEIINVDNSGNIVNEPILYVTSKNHKMIDQSWNDITALSTMSIAQSTTLSTGINRPSSANSVNSNNSVDREQSKSVITF